MSPRRARRAITTLLGFLMVLTGAVTSSAAHADEVAPSGYWGAALGGEYLFGTSKPYYVLPGGKINVNLYAQNLRVQRQMATADSRGRLAWKNAGAEWNTPVAAVLYPHTFTLSRSQTFPAHVRFRITPLFNVGAPFYTPAQKLRTYTRPYTPPKSSWKTWSLINTHSRSHPARINPCKTWTLRADMRGLRRGSKTTAVKDIRRALAYVASNTGLNIKYLGQTTSDDTMFGRMSRSANVTVVWGSGGYKKYGPFGATANFQTEPLMGAPFLRITKAKVVVNAQADNSSWYRQLVLRHELMHTIGAGHSVSGTGLMSSKVSSARFESGERYVAQVLGKRAGCY